MNKKEESIQKQIDVLRNKLSQEKRKIAQQERKLRDKARYVAGGSLIKYLAHIFCNKPSSFNDQIRILFPNKDSADYQLVVDAIMYESSKIKKGQEGRTQS